MHSTLKRIISISITICLMFALLIPVYAQSDITNHWARSTFEKWTAEGLLKGYADGSYKPDNIVSKVEFLAFIDRIFKYADTSEKKPKDVVSGSWFEAVISKALAAEIIQIDINGNIEPQKAITRGAAAVIVAKAFNLKANNPDSIKKYKDYTGIPSENRDAIAAMTEKGYIKGNADNTFGYGRPVTRAEAVTIINRAMGTVVKSSGTYKSSVTGNLTVNAKDVVLKDITIGGDLYLTQGIGQGSVTLDKVKVTGKTYILGGGVNGITIKDSVLSGALVLMKKDGKLRVSAQGTSEIINTFLNSGAVLEEQNLTGQGFAIVNIMQLNPAGNSVKLSGSFSNISLKDKGTDLQLLSGSVNNLYVLTNASGAAIYVDAAFAVSNIVADADLKALGKGYITNTFVNCAGVVFEQAPSNLSLAGGISVTIGGEVKNTSYGNTGAAPADISGRISFVEAPADITVTQIQLKQGSANFGPAIKPDASGAYRICGIPTGTYYIEIILDGYKTVSSESFVFKGTGITNINFNIEKSISTLASDEFYVYPGEGIPGDACAIYLAYVAGEKLVNGTVVFTLPPEFKATTNDAYKILAISSDTTIRLTADQISNNGTTVTIKGISTQESRQSRLVVLYLSGRTVPAAGEYKFTASADADGPLTEKTFSSSDSNVYEYVSGNGPVVDFRAFAGDSTIRFSFSPCKDSTLVVLQMSTDGGKTYQHAPDVTLAPESDGCNVDGLTNGDMYMFRLVVTGGRHNGTTEPITISPTRIDRDKSTISVDPVISVNTDGTFDKHNIITFYLKDIDGNPISNSYESINLFFCNYSDNMNKAIYINGATESVSDINETNHISKYFIPKILTDSQGKFTIKISIKAPLDSIYDGAIIFDDPDGHDMGIYKFNNK